MLSLTPRFRVWAIAVLCAAAVHAPALAACQCSGADNVPDAFAGADAVFMGRLVGWTSKNWLTYREGTRKSTEENALDKRATFIVERWWKGGGTDTAEVVTAGNTDQCGVDFSLGQKYLVYSRYDAATNQLRTDACSRTTGPILPDNQGEIEQDLEALDRLISQ